LEESSTDFLQLSPDLKQERNLKGSYSGGSYSSSSSYSYYSRSGSNDDGGVFGGFILSLFLIPASFALLWKNEKK